MNSNKNKYEKKSNYIKLKNQKIQTILYFITFNLVV